MSFQVPGNMIIVGSMLTFYKSTPAVIFWQWVNQTFNATVNYTNRNATTEISQSQLTKAYLAATTSAVLTALGLNRAIARFPAVSNGLLGRFVPLVAMSAANCCNIPLMRQNELKEGIKVTDENGVEVGKSQIAAKYAISQVIVSRIAMAIPASTIPPVIMNYLCKRPFLSKYPIMNAPIQCLLVGANLVISTPLACAFFPQMSSIKVSKLEPEFRAKIVNGKPLEKVYYNKGL